MAATSVREVARAAGVSIGTVTYHFSGIDELLTEVLHVTLRDFYRPRRRRLDPDATALDRLRLLIDEHFTSPELYEQCVIWIEYWPARYPRALGPRLAASALLDVPRYIARVLAAGAEAGEFAVHDPDPAGHRVPRAVRRALRADGGRGHRHGIRTTARRRFSPEPARRGDAGASPADARHLSRDRALRRTACSTSATATRVYWETCGNPLGKAARWWCTAGPDRAVHHASAAVRPGAYRTVLFDQRGLWPEPPERR